MAIMVVLSIVLNSYWFWLMLKMIIRVVKRALNPPPEENEEKIELVKADSLALQNEAECAKSTEGSIHEGGSEEIEEELGGNVDDI